MNDEKTSSILDLTLKIISTIQFIQVENAHLQKRRAEPARDRPRLSAFIFDINSSSIPKPSSDPPSNPVETSYHR